MLEDKRSLIIEQTCYKFGAQLSLYFLPDLSEFLYASQDFLNGVCTNIIHLHHRQLKYYTGNYDQYVKTRLELEENQMKCYSWEQEQMAHMKKPSNALNWQDCSTSEAPTFLNLEFGIDLDT